MAKFITAAVLVLGSVSAVCTAQGEINYWGTVENYTCFNICGNCVDQPCNEQTGLCTGGCAEGWKGEDCTQPVCKPKLCGSLGSCVAPNECVCPDLQAKYEDKAGNIGCYSLRANGLKGAFISMAILATAITICWAIGKHSYKKSA